MFDGDRLLRLTAHGVEIADIRRDPPLMRALAMDEAEQDSFIVHLLQANEIGGLAAAIVVEDQVIVVADRFEGAVLDGLAVASLVHRFAVKRNAGPVPGFDPRAWIFPSLQVGRNMIAIVRIGAVDIADDERITL